MTWCTSHSISSKSHMPEAVNGSAEAIAAAAPSSAALTR